MNAPQAPNVAQETMMQSALNTQAAQQQQQMNMVGQNNAYGSLTYAATPGSPSGWTANTTLSAPEQTIFNNSTNAAGTESGVAAKLAASGAGALGGAGPDLGFNGINAQVNADEKNTLDPQWAAAGNSEAATLAGEGVMPGSESYNTQMQQFNNSKNTAYDQMFIGDQAQAQNEALTAYNAPVNALTALQSGSQVTNPNSSFVATPQQSITAPNYMGAQQQNYQNATSQYDAMLGGVASLGGTLGGAGIRAFGQSSDRNDKTDISELGKDPKTGLEMYAYRYKGDPKTYPKTVGPMAQDIEKKAPGAVRSIGGHKVVKAGLGLIARRKVA
jgi:hypothetical protein